MFDAYTAYENTSTVVGYYICVSSALILVCLLRNLDISIKALTMFIAHMSEYNRKFIEMALEKINLYAHV